MKAQHRPGPGPLGNPVLLAERGFDALRQERFKDAIEVLKQAIRQDPRPEWKEGLIEAWSGRARVLAGKQMYKEAALVLENALAYATSVPDPILYFTCLIRDNQQQKAAAYFLSHPEAATENPELEATVAALLVAVPQLPDPAPRATPEQTHWRELALAARGALEAWCNGAGAQEIDQRLNAISLRSAFRPLRLLLKTLLTPSSPDRTRQVLETIPPGSPFYPLRQAVALGVAWTGSPDASAWNRLTPAQQTFLAQTAALPSTASQFLARLAAAEGAGPRALFDFLIKQADRSPPDVRNACLNLLPQISDRTAPFEKVFGALSHPERCRIQALGAEARGDWQTAGHQWQKLVEAIGGPEDPDPHAGRARGVVLRHLAALAAKHEEIEAPRYGDPVVYFLERARAEDPDYIATYLELIGRYRKDASSEEWRRLVDESVRRFPDDARVLQEALDNALSRKAYKQAEGFARRLLKINSINPGVRRQMIDLQISYARKQMGAKRPDLALAAMKEASSWERPEAPNGPLRIVQGLVERRTGDAGPAETKVREGVALAGGAVGGWFRAAMEAGLMKEKDTDWLHRELDRALGTPPTADAVLAVVSVAGQATLGGENRKTVATLVRRIQPWLEQAATIDWKPAEFEAVVEMLRRFELYDALGAFARSAGQRDPANPSARFHAIVASSLGDPENMKPGEDDELEDLAEQAREREDFPLLNRIGRFLDGEADQDRNAPLRRRRPVEAPDDLDPGSFVEMFRRLLKEMPNSTAANLRKQVRDQGREHVVSSLMDELARSEMGSEMPKPLMRMFCEAMILQAMQGGNAGAGRGRSFF